MTQHNEGMSHAEVLAVMDHEASVMADDNCPLQADRMRQARAAVAAMVAERDRLLTVRETLKRECEALIAENARLREAIDSASDAVLAALTGARHD